MMTMMTLTSHLTQAPVAGCLFCVKFVPPAEPSPPLCRPAKVNRAQVKFVMNAIKKVDCLVASKKNPQNVFQVRWARKG